MARSVDRTFLYIVLALTISGFLIFISATFGVLTKNFERFTSLLINQGLLGLALGGLVCFFVSRIHYKFWRKYALVIFLAAIIFTALVFVPALSFAHGGARRWLSFGPFSFQPAEFLKLAFVSYAAALLSKKMKQKNGGWKEKFVAMAALVCALGLPAGLLLMQPDISSLLIIIASFLGLVVTSGKRLREIAIVSLLVGAGAVFAVYNKPYINERLLSFINPAADPLGSGYQIQQSLIGIGAGGLTGRGFGQSVQKFSYLPEAMGDSVFAVIGEEFGFIGSVLTTLLFAAFGLRGLWIASRAPDDFSRLLTVGIVILITGQSLLNIASMIGLLPLSGMPLIYVSQGGSALLLALAEAGIVLNISKFIKA